MELLFTVVYVNKLLNGLSSYVWRLNHFDVFPSVNWLRLLNEERLSWMGLDSLEIRRMKHIGFRKGMKVENWEVETQQAADVGIYSNKHLLETQQAEQHLLEDTGCWSRSMDHAASQENISVQNPSQWRLCSLLIHVRLRKCCLTRWTTLDTLWFILQTRIYSSLFQLWENGIVDVVVETLIRSETLSFTLS